MREINRKTAQYQQLLNGLQKVDPRLYDIMQLMSKDVVSLLNVVSPVKVLIEEGGLPSTYKPQPPDVFTVSYTERAVTFAWHCSDSHARYFELKKGDDWSTADFVLRTPSLTASINPLMPGTYTYLLKTLSEAMVESKDYLSLTFTVDPMGTPVVTVQAVDNNVSISWELPFHLFAIDHYNVYKGETKVAEVSGTTLVRIETLGGRLAYGVEAVDVAGYVSPKGYGQATVRDPPDYILQNLRTTGWPGEFTNCYVEDGKLIACVDLTEVYQTHFTSKSWDSPQDQVDAGYLRFIQENPTTGSYDESHDYSTLQDPCVVSYNYVKEILEGCTDVDVVVKTYYKTAENDSWSAALEGLVVQVPSFRYLRTLIEFTGTDDKSMISLSNFTIKLDVKLETDNGSVSALSTDGSGTTVSFNKVFKTLRSVVCTPQGTTDIKAVVDSLDPATGFKVFCFNTAGTRVSATVYWVARGTT
jgi:hypothetical protein